MRAVDRARSAISGLLALSPDTADLRQADGTWKSPAGRIYQAATQCVQLVVAKRKRLGLPVKLTPTGE